MAKQEGNKLPRSHSMRAMTEKEKELLNAWYKKCLEYNHSHGVAAWFYQGLRRAFSIVDFLFPTAAAVLVKCEVDEQWYFWDIPITLGLALGLALLGSICIAIRSNVNFQGLYAIHHASQLKWRQLENNVKDTFMYKEVNDVPRKLRDIRARYDELLAGDPLIMQRLFQMAKAKIDRLGVTPLEPKDVSLSTKDHMESQDLEESHVKDLEVRFEQARKNRQKLMEDSIYYRFMDQIVCCTLASLSVVGTAVSFATIVASRQNGDGHVAFPHERAFLIKCTAFVNGLTAGLSLFDSTNQFSETSKNYQEFSTQWSSLGREIEATLAVKQREDPEKVFLDLERRCRELVDELMKQGITHISKREVEVDKRGSVSDGQSNQRENQRLLIPASNHEGQMVRL